jgi:hypothetical protein
MEQLLYPDAHDWIGALQAGQQAGMTQRRNAAAVQAGGFMANGDYKGAASALYGAGDIAGGSAIAQAGYTQKSEADKLVRQQAVQAKISSNDIAGAYAAAGTDKDLIEALDKVSAHAKETTAQTAAALQALKDPTTGQWLPPDQARAKYQQIKPTLIARGLPQAQLDAFDPTPENLQAMQSQVLGLDKQLELAKPVVVGKDLVNPQTGAAVYRGPNYEKVGPGETLLNVGGPSGAGGPAAPTGAPGPQMTHAEAPVPTGGVYDQVAQLAAAKGAKPEEVAYLQRLAHVESHGDPAAQNGRSTGVFQFHPDTFAANGGKDITDVGQQTSAALNLSRHDRAKLQAMGVEPSDANAYIMHQQGPGGGPALLSAPPEVNAVAALTPVYGGNAKLAERAIVGNGGTPDMTAGQFVDMWRQRWANGGRPAAAGGGQAVAAPAATAAPTAPAGGPQVVFRGAPAWRSDGKGFLRNDATGDIKPDPSAADAVAFNADRVKGIIEGRVPVPTANRAATDPKWQADFNEAMRQDPTLDAANYGTRVKTRADFATGTAAKTKTALNTALGHAGDLYAQVDGLGGTPLPAINMVKNAVENQTGDPRVKTFNLTKEALLHEAMKVFSGSQGSMTEFAQLAENLKVDDSPAQQRSVIKKLVGLLASKMDALGEQYKTGMGKELDQSQIMSPHAQSVFNKISGLPGGGEGAAPAAGSASAAPAPPRVGAVVKGYTFLGGDPADPKSWAKAS